MGTYRKTLDKKRIEKGLTLTELARRAGVGLNTVSMIVNGRTNPVPRTQHAIADALETTPAEIFPEVAQ